jgi:hypothetical protein
VIKLIFKIPRSGAEISMPKICPEAIFLTSNSGSYNNLSDSYDVIG